MTIIRAPRPDHGFLLVANDVARDARLSYRARGLLLAILSRPDDWQTDYRRLAREGKEGESAVRTALKELRAAGYIQQVRRQVERGRWETVNVIHDRPVPPDDASAQVAPSVGIPNLGGPKPGEPTPLRSTDTDDCHEEGVERGDLADARSARPNFDNWRDTDRALFTDLLEGQAVRSDGRMWNKGTFTADAFYEAFRTRKRNPLDWPGRFLAELAERPDGIDDWLLGQGLELVEARRPA